jgi:hypothetical protein
MAEQYDQDVSTIINNRQRESFRGLENEASKDAQLIYNPSLSEKSRPT